MSCNTYNTIPLYNFSKVPIAQHILVECSALGEKCSLEPCCACENRARNQLVDCGTRSRRQCFVQSVCRVVEQVLKHSLCREQCYGLCSIVQQCFVSLCSDSRSTLWDALWENAFSCSAWKTLLYGCMSAQSALHAGAAPCESSRVE